MRRKSNPWVALVALTLLPVLVICCSSCESLTDAAEIDTAEIDTAEDAPRFIIEEVSVDNQSAIYSRIAIITDTETGVQYIFVRSSNSGGLTVLEPAPEKEAEQ